MISVPYTIISIDPYHVAEHMFVWSGRRQEEQVIFLLKCTEKKTNRLPHFVTTNSCKENGLYYVIWYTYYAVV